MNRYQRSHEVGVVVQFGTALYMDTAENFKADAGIDAPGLPGLIYAPGKMNCIIDADGNQRAGLDAADAAAFGLLIARAGQLVAAQSARLAAVAAAAAAVRLAAMTIDEKRAIEYAKRGATMDALTVALWERLVENRSTATDALQLVRAQVKGDLPK